MSEKPKYIPEQESPKKDSPYSEKELQWLKEQKAEYYRLKKIWDVPEDHEETEEIREARRKSLEIAQAVKKMKMERELGEHDIKYMDTTAEIPKGAFVSEAKIVNGDIYFLKSENRKVSIEGPKGFKSIPCEDTFLGEYRGRLIYMGDENLVYADGEKVKVHTDPDYIGFDVIDDKIYFTKIVDEDNLQYYDEAGEPIGKPHEVVTCLKKINGEYYYTANDGNEYIENGDGVKKSPFYLFARSPMYYKGKLAFIAKRGKNDWRIINEGGKNLDKEHSYEAHSLVGFDESFVFAKKNKNDKWMVSDGSKNIIPRTYFEKIYEIGKIDENHGFVLGKKGNKLIKRVFDIREVK